MHQTGHPLRFWWPGLLASKGERSRGVSWEPGCRRGPKRAPSQNVSYGAWAGYTAVQSNLSLHKGNWRVPRIQDNKTLI
jgi:hypothetical protein